MTTTFMQLILRSRFVSQRLIFITDVALSVGATALAYLLLTHGEFYQFNLSSCIRQQNSLTAQFVSFSLSNLANIFYPPQFLQ